MGVLDRVFAGVYDRVLAPSEVRGLADRRAALLGDLSGFVVEIGAGTGLNLAHYPSDLERLVLCEPSAEMAAKLEIRLTDGPQLAEIIAAPAEVLPFDTGKVDHVVSTLVLCTVNDLEASLLEIRRVLKPGGTLRLFEHVAHPTSPGWRKAQDVIQPVWGVLARGCHLQRDILAALEQTGFDVSGVERTRMPGAADLASQSIQGIAVSH